MNKPKECYGCKSNAPDDYYDTIVNPEPSLICEIPPKFKYGNHICECPCVSCIVKAICNTTCQSVRQYIDKYSSHFHI